MKKIIINSNEYFYEYKNHTIDTRGNAFYKYRGKRKRLWFFEYDAYEFVFWLNGYNIESEEFSKDEMKNKLQSLEYEYIKKENRRREIERGEII